MRAGWLKPVAGDDVRFTSWFSAHEFRGKVLRTFGEVAEISDRSGLPPRLVRADRLIVIGGGRRQIFSGGAA